jgi:hypothetical protein
VVSQPAPPSVSDSLVRCDVLHRRRLDAIENEHLSTAFEAGSRPELGVASPYRPALCWATERPGRGRMGASHELTASLTQTTLGASIRGGAFMRKFIVSLWLTVLGLALTIAPVLAETIGPTPR